MDREVAPARILRRPRDRAAERGAVAVQRDPQVGVAGEQLVEHGPERPAPASDGERRGEPVGHLRPQVRDVLARDAHDGHGSLAAGGSNSHVQSELSML